MNVCTRCYLTVDKDRVALFQITDDPTPFMAYDLLGCIALIGFIDASVSTERDNPR